MLQIGTNSASIARDEPKFVFSVTKIAAATASDSGQWPGKHGRPLAGG